MSRQLSDVLEMFSARGPQLRDVGRFAQRSAVFNAPKRPTTLDAIDAKSAMTHYSNDPRPDFPDVTGQKPGDLPSYLWLVKGLLVGEPEKLLSGEMSQIGDASGLSFSYPSGLPDALAALPMFGGIMRAAKNTARPFFSSLARALSERAPAIGTAEHFLNVARKGGKAEELAWTGLEDWLKSQPGKIKRDDVLKYVEDNLPELRERMIGMRADPKKINWTNDTGRTSRIAQSESGNIYIHQNTNGIFEAHSNNPPEYLGYGDTIEDAKRMAENVLGSRESIKPKFTTDNLVLPGGENHRELVVMMPSKDTADFDVFNEWLRKHPSQHQAYTNGDDATRSDVLTLFHQTEDKVNYSVPAGHAYGDPELDVNRLFHARMNDRTTAEGERALHLEELQSDWHQTGRKEGYGTEGKWNVVDGDTGEPIAIFNSEREASDYWFSHPSRENLSVNQAESELGVPDAPFKSTWHELGMRRMLQEAVDGDYARLTWTTGEQQADRYSLAKVVDKLRYDPVTQELTGYKGRGLGPIITQKVAPADLPDYIGREAADKLLATTPGQGRLAFHELTGQDLRLGGEGMKGFYDKMLPSYMNKIGKKYGVKAEMTNVETGRTNQSLALEISNAANKMNDATRPLLNEVARHVADLGKKPLDALKDIRALRLGTYKKEDYEFVDEFLKKLPPKGAEQVWSMKITPEMRQDLLEKGQPLFNVSPPVPLPRYERKKTTRDLSMWPAH